MQHKLLPLLLALALLPACQSSSSSGSDDDTDTGTDSDTDTDVDTNSDTDSDTDTGDPFEPGSMCPGYPDTPQSFIWIANSKEGTLSKVCTTSATEVARYLTSAYGDLNDPSRTSVNLHGDVVVSNRRDGSFIDWGEGESSVTKFAADVAECTEDFDTCVWDSEEAKCAQCVESCDGCDPTCIVLAWENDGCMLWNTELAGDEGARATAWDGLEDPETGEGGHVWVGTSGGARIHKIDGDTGLILEEEFIQGIGAAEVAYGGAMDGLGNLWMADWPAGQRSIWKWDMGTMTGQEFLVDCAYGIAVDNAGRIWTSGQGESIGNGISIFTPDTEELQTIGASDVGSTYLRGIAAGVPGTPSEGYMWTVDTYGMLLKVDMESLVIVETALVGDSGCSGSDTEGHSLVGVAVDFEGYVWAVSYCLDMAFKVDPVSFDQVEVPIGDGPYTYSDMTGMQLKIVVNPE